MHLNLLYGFIIGYLLGSLQFPYFIGKWVGRMDVRNTGSGNAGASNITNLLGWRWGILTAILDIAKGACAAWLGGQFAAPDFSAKLLMYIAGTSAVLGHIYPFYLRFQGGKGLAALMGFLLVFNWQFALLMAALLIAITLVSDYIAIGTLVLYFALPIEAMQSADQNWTADAIVIFGLASFLTVLGLSKHRINIYRISRKEETGLREVFKKHKKGSKS